MKKRLEALQKIERLQRQLHDLAVWRLNALARERETLAEDHRAMLAAMEGGVMSYGAPAAAALRRIRALEVQMAAAEKEHAAQSEHARDQGARAKLADRARESVDAHYRDHKQRKDLADLVDASLRNPKSSSA